MRGPVILPGNRHGYIFTATENWTFTDESFDYGTGDPSHAFLAPWLTIMPMPESVQKELLDPKAKSFINYRETIRKAIIISDDGFVSNYTADGKPGQMAPRRQYWEPPPPLPLGKDTIRKVDTPTITAPPPLP